MHLGSIWLIPDGGYNLMDIRDFSNTVVKSIEKGQNAQVYLTGGDFMHLKDLLLIANPKGKVFTMSIDFLIKLLPLVGIFKVFVPSLKELNKESLITLKFAPRSVDSSRAETDLGYQCRPITETVHDLISWMKAKNLLNE